MSLENLKCPDCSGPMVPRTNKADGTKFWGCKSFPKCRGTRDSMGLSKEERNLEYNAEKEESESFYKDRFNKSRRYD